MKREPIRVLLDASILMRSSELGLDIFGEISGIVQTRAEHIVIGPVYEELKRMASGPPAKAAKARVALELVKRGCKVQEFVRSKGEPVDEALLRAARELRGIAATADEGLRKRLKGEGIITIYVRGQRLYCDEVDLIKYGL